MYQIKIVDDDSAFVEYMQDIILKCDIEKEKIVFEKFYSGEEFVARLDSMSACDLLILDMQMKELDGHGTARRFRDKFPRSVMVFCSGVSHPTDESFKTAPFRYLSKGYSEETMKKEMEVIVQEMKKTARITVIMGRNHTNFIKLYPEDIMYIENRKNGSIIHLCEHKAKDFAYQVNTNEKLAELYEKLRDYKFEYAHNSYLVNLCYVTKLISHRYLQLSDGTELNVSRSKLQTFRNALAGVLSSKYEYVP